MALIPGFEYDIFISYAHVDNIALPDQANGWIEQFYKNLNLMMAKRYGRLDIVKIWWDTRKLDGSILFDQSIADGIKKSAIMICLYSPGYEQSNYCKQELDIFYQKAQAEKTGLKVGDRYRIINVLLNNIPHKQWPSELAGISGFPFNDAKGADEAEDYGDPLDTASPEFRTQMQNLRDAVWSLLNNFSKNAVTDTPQLTTLTNTITDTPQPTTSTNAAADVFTIYMGEVTDTLRVARKRAITEIEKNGFKVVSGIPPPDEANAHENAVKDALQNTQLAVHLFDTYPGREILGDPDKCYPQKQAELSLLADKPKMIWMPADTVIENIQDDNYKLFLQGIENGTTEAKGYEFIRGSQSTLSQQIIDAAEQLKAKQLQKQAAKGKVPVLVDTHINDQLYAFDLSKTLLENQIQPFINPQEDDPRKNINLLADRISQVKKLIFLYGSVSKEWVLERMSAALQLIINNNFPIEDFFVYLAPPHKDVNDISLKQKFLKINVFDSSNSVAVDTLGLQKFLSDLKADVA